MLKIPKSHKFQKMLNNSKIAKNFKKTLKMPEITVNLKKKIKKNLNVKKY
jgi:hypothetical protein